MSFLKTFWNKICEPLDGFLWHKDITHPVIRPLLRNQILAGGSTLLLGSILFIVSPWLFWFGCGLLCMSWVFWSWARFFLGMDPDQYGSVFVRAFFFNFGIRFILLAILLYLALAIFHASIVALALGLITGTLLALLTFAFKLKN